MLSWIVSTKIRGCCVESHPLVLSEERCSIYTQYICPLIGVDNMFTLQLDSIVSSTSKGGKGNEHHRKMNVRSESVCAHKRITWSMTGSHRRSTIQAQIFITLLRNDIFKKRRSKDENRWQKSYYYILFYFFNGLALKKYFIKWFFRQTTVWHFNFRRLLSCSSADESISPTASAPVRWGKKWGREKHNNRWAVTFIVESLPVWCMCIPPWYKKTRGEKILGICAKREFRLRGPHLPAARVQGSSTRQILLLNLRRTAHS